MTKEQPKSKFKVGDKVRLLINNGHHLVICTIKEIEWNDIIKMWMYRFDADEVLGTWYEYSLEPYTEPKNMETKELNLCELLKGCERMEVYSLLEGTTFIRNVSNTLITTTESNNYAEKGNVYADGECLLYPSKALYEKYPLDAYSAWMEWKESRTSKQWKPKTGEEYYSLSGALNVIKLNYFDNEIDKVLSEAYNKFPTSEIAQQAAEIVKDALQKFHKQHAIN